MKQRIYYLFLLIPFLVVHSCTKEDDGPTVIEVVPEIDPATEKPIDKILTDSIQIEVNPTGIAPLSALASFTSSVPINVQIAIAGKIPIEHSFPAFNTRHSIPLVGFYPGINNEVIFTLTTEAGAYAKDTLAIAIPEIHEFLPEIDISAYQPAKSEPGFTLVDFSVGKYGNLLFRPFIFDPDGIIRWYLNPEALEGWIGPIKRLRNGNFLFARYREVFEYDLLGEQVNKWELPEGFAQHHEIIEKADGNFLVAVSELPLDTDYDQIIEIDRASGALVKQWDLREVLDVDRYDLYWNSRDWVHVNSIYFDESDQSLLMSGRHQGVFKLSYDNELIYVIAPHKGWETSGIDENGPNTSDFLLQAVDAEGIPYADSVQNGFISLDEFDWSWSQHAALTMPNGNVLVFDNGANRNYTYTVGLGYSRGVEYAIDLEQKTVRQVWEYGRERGDEFYSVNISDIDYLETTGNRLVISGNIEYENVRRGIIVEVSPENNEVVFEAAVNFSNIYSTGGGWGETDIMYRAERLSMYPKN